MPKNRVSTAGQLQQVAALATVKTLEDFGCQAGIKWVNDTFLNGKKISGCLCELLPSNSKEHNYLLVGIGLNVNMEQEELSKISRPATSIYAETLQKTNVEGVLESLSFYVQNYFSRLIHGDNKKLNEEINEALLFKNHEIEFETSYGDTLRGKLIGVNVNGDLMFEGWDKKLRRVMKMKSGRILNVFGASGEVLYKAN